ncbi:Hypp9616 [Branchiostoma lanceolatum]|uniref:Hypp9616 protein n=1 Tax=Branchiostoma lanceolatum TaxID=7740 RepID=A0A8S4MNC1_BRALA|nr:Hypp9616 [Branchiostoma lanceolatum]
MREKKYKYRRAKKSNEKSGRISCPFYDEIEQIIGDRPATTPHFTMEPVCKYLRFMRLFRGPGWSGIASQDKNNPLKEAGKLSDRDGLETHLRTLLVDIEEDMSPLARGLTAANEKYQVPAEELNYGEFNSLRTLGKERPIHIYEVIRQVKDSTRNTGAATILKFLRKVGGAFQGFTEAEEEEEAEDGVEEARVKARCLGFSQQALRRWKCSSF